MRGRPPLFYTIHCSLHWTVAA